jgi:hypothetical protein
MQEIMHLNLIAGGKGGKKGNNNTISELPELFLALNSHPGLKDDLQNLLQHPEIMDLLSNPEKMSAVLELFSRMDPAFVRELPQIYEDARDLGFI